MQSNPASLMQGLPAALLDELSAKGAVEVELVEQNGSGEKYYPADLLANGTWATPSIRLKVDKILYE